MKYRLFYSKCWLTPMERAKVLEERSGKGSRVTPVIQYKRKKVVEDLEMAGPEAISAFLESHYKPLEGVEGVAERFLDLFGFCEASDGEKCSRMEGAWTSVQEDLL